MCAHIFESSPSKHSPCYQARIFSTSVYVNVGCIYVQYEPYFCMDKALQRFYLTASVVLTVRCHGSYFEKYGICLYIQTMWCRYR